VNVSDVERLERCLRDVFSLLALPALWSGRDSGSLLQTLVEALESVLPLDLAYAAARTHREGPLGERLRVHGVDVDPTAEPWRARLQALGDGDMTPKSARADVDGLGRVCFTRLPLGYYAEYGVILVAAARADFPTAHESATLQAAVALTTTGLHTTRVIEEREAAMRLKDQFLAMLGHELRNPLGAITAATAVLGRDDVPQRMTAQAYQVLRRQTGQLTRLLDDLLDVSRATSGHLRLEREAVSLPDIVERAVAVTRAAEPDRHEFTVATKPVVVWGDAARIEQIAMNLLTNAVHYTPAGGSIRVSVDEDGPCGLMRIEDSGIGIAPELLPRLFEVFVRGGLSTGRGSAGLGMGLALVKKLVDLHEGTVSAHSEGPNRGSTFTVRLPRATTTSLAAPPSRSSASTRRHVLIVEDNDDNRLMLGELLRLHGHDVVDAADGTSGLRVASARRPDVALVDIGLPDMDGYELARRLRAQLGATIRLVAVTGFGQPEDRARSRRAGFDAHLVKPVSPEAIEAALDPPSSRPRVA
jgi:signal transduction histidine kinase/ActR/RegA family two-component response regulator